jgi:MoaA/NifB/PqqE/SkfB family radical SAM enzyme
MSVGLKKLMRAPWGALAHGVYEYNVQRHFGTLPPRQLQVNVTYHCNGRCTMCNIWQMPERPELTEEKLRLVAQDPIFGGIERLTLAGGEPSLRRDLVPLTGALVERMPRLRSVTLITNGLAVDRVLDDTRGLLALCSPRGMYVNISVSLDGVGVVHDGMRNVPGAFSHVERCLNGL